MALGSKCKEMGFNISNFQIDWDREKVICPAGRKSSSWKTMVDRRGNDVLSRTSQTGADALKSFWTPTRPEVGNWFDQVKFQEMYFCDVTTFLPEHRCARRRAVSNRILPPIR